MYHHSRERRAIRSSHKSYRSGNGDQRIEFISDLRAILHDEGNRFRDGLGLVGFEGTGDHGGRLTGGGEHEFEGNLFLLDFAAIAHEISGDDNDDESSYVDEESDETNRKAQVSKIRVLVVDDEQGNLDTFYRVFRKHFSIVTERSPIQAIERVKSQEFDIVVLDYSMHELNGKELLACIREFRPELPCLFVTAYAEVEEVQDAARELGVNRLIMKPWEKDDLEHWINSTVRVCKIKKASERPS